MQIDHSAMRKHTHTTNKKQILSEKICEGHIHALNDKMLKQVEITAALEHISNADNLQQPCYDLSAKQFEFCNVKFLKSFFQEQILISFISVSKSKIYNAQPDNKIVKHILQSISITCIHTY